MCEKTYKADETQLGRLMVGLIYPAFLGSAFVWFFTSIATRFNENVNSVGDFFHLFYDINTVYSIWLIVYFCISFTILAWFPNKKKYDLIMFLISTGEALVIFFGFFYLDFIVEINKVRVNNLDITSSAKAAHHLQLFYFFSLGIPIFALLFNWYVKGKKRWCLIIPAFAISLFSALKGYNYLCFNWFAFTTLSVLLVIYIVQFKER